MAIQLQRVRADDVVVEHRDLENNSPRGYEDLNREMSARRRNGERIRAVSDDSPFYVRPFASRLGDLQ